MNTKKQEINDMKKTNIKAASLSIPFACIWNNKNAIEIITIRVISFKLILFKSILNEEEKKSMAIQKIAKLSMKGIKRAKLMKLKNTLPENIGALVPSNPRSSFNGTILANEEAKYETAIRITYAMPAKNMALTHGIFLFVNGICLCPKIPSAKTNANEITKRIV